MIATASASASSRNCACYGTLNVIENSLRGLCTVRLSKRYGAKWYKSQLSPTAQRKYVDGLAYERSQFSLGFTSYHPVYYLDFSDLREILCRKDNWRECFSDLFGEKNYELLTSSLSELEPIRNKVAHNRLVSDHELSVANSFLDSLTQWLGADEINQYTEDSAATQPVFATFTIIRPEIIALTDQVARYLPIRTDSLSGPSYFSNWWWDISYVGNELAEIDNFYDLITQYAQLERGRRGTGFAVEAWVAGSSIAERSTHALDACKALIDRGRREEGSAR